MDEIIKTVRDLNRAFKHNAEPVFVNTITGKIDASHAPSLRANPIPPDLIREWMEGNYGFVHPDYPNFLFFAVDRIEGPDLYACCGFIPLFTCEVCHSQHAISGAALANHEFIHSLQLRLNPYIGHGLAENVATDLELVDIADLTGFI